MTSLPRRLALALVVPLLTFVAACSGGAGATASPTPGGAGTDASTEPEASSAVASAEASADDPGPNPWAVTASEHRGRDGEQFDYECPAGGEEYAIWGTDVYTDDSSVCIAAVHVGIITLDDGGDVTIEIRPGEDEYEASERNGIMSRPYGPWGGSFVIVDE